MERRVESVVVGVSASVTHGLGDLPDLLENRGFLYSRGEMLISFPHGHSRLRFIEIIGVKIKAQIIITVTPLSHRRGRGVSIYNGIRTWLKGLERPKALSTHNKLSLSRLITRVAWSEMCVRSHFHLDASTSDPLNLKMVNHRSNAASQDYNTRIKTETWCLIVIHLRCV